jgi:hypothetical protein
VRPSTQSPPASVPAMTPLMAARALVQARRMLRTEAGDALDNGLRARGTHASQRSRRRRCDHSSHLDGELQVDSGIVQPRGAKDHGKDHDRGRHEHLLQGLGDRTTHRLLPRLASVSGVPPIMVKTASNPGGLPREVFDGVQAQIAANRAQFYRDLPAGPFYGYNRPGAKASEGIIQNWWRQGMMGGAKARPMGWSPSRRPTLRPI